MSQGRGQYEANNHGYGSQATAQQQYPSTSGRSQPSFMPNQHQYHHYPQNQPPVQQQQQQQQQQQRNVQQQQQNVEWYSGMNMSSAGQTFGQQASPYDPSQYKDMYSKPFSGGGGGEYGSFEEDAPLLEELGIDVPAIMHRIKAILTFRFASSDADSLDLGGPIIFMSIFATAHLLVGKLHFGYILGWTVVGSVLLWFILSSIAAGDDDDSDQDCRNSLDLYSCCSIVGYSLLPLVMHAALSLLFPRRSAITIAIAIVAVMWAAGASSKLFMLRSRALKRNFSVVAYPCMLMYTAFAMLTLY